MSLLTDVKITKIEKGKSGTHKEYGDWQAWSLWIDDADWKDTRLSYMQGQGKPEPKEGIILATLEFEKEGKFYNVKKFTEKGEKPKPEPDSPSGGYFPKDPRAFYYSYAKDIVVEYMKSHTDESLPMLIARTTHWGEFLYRCSQGDEKALDRAERIIATPPDYPTPSEDEGDIPDYEPPADEESTTSQENYKVFNTLFAELSDTKWKSESQLKEWASKNKETIDKLPNKQKKALRDTYKQETNQLKGK